VLSLFSVEVLFKQIDLVVLADALARRVYQVGGGRLETEINLTKHLFLILGNVQSLSVVELLGPATNCVTHSSVLSDHTLCVDAVFRHQRNVVQNDGVRVTQGVFSLFIARLNGPDNL